MIVTLMRKESIKKIVISNNSIHKCCIYDDNNEKLVEFEKDNKIWKLRSTNEVKIIKAKDVRFINGEYKENLSAENIPDLTLKEGLFTFIKLEKFDEICIIYCSKFYEDNYTQLKLKNVNRITIGKNSKNHISYDFPLMSNFSMQIYFLNGKCYLDPLSEDAWIYINDNSINNQIRILNNGDRIFIFGLNILYNNNSFFINNPFDMVHINSDYLYKVSINTKNENNFNKRLISYNKEQYFIRPPRTIGFNKKKTYSIVSPRIEPEQKNTPMIIAMGSSFGMMLTSLISLTQNIYSFSKGGQQVDSFVFSLIMTGTMMLTSIVLPIITRRATDKFNKKEKIKERIKYKKYIDELTGEIIDTKEEYRKNLYMTYPSADECLKIVIDNSTRLWERKITDEDFLNVRIGVSTIPSNIEIEGGDVEKGINQLDESAQLMLNCIETSKTVDNAPVVISIKKSKLVGIISRNENEINGFMQQILCQLITFYSYYDLKLVFFLKKNTNKKMNYVKTFPHAWSNEKQMRFFANDEPEFREISNYLKKVLSKQKELVKNNKPISTHYIIIVDDYVSVENIDIIEEILKTKDDIGFSILFLTNDIYSLPNDCHTLIELNDETAILTETLEKENSQVDIYLDNINNIIFNKVIEDISNITMKHEKEAENKLPESCTFLEMHNVSSIEELKIWERWTKNDTTRSLAAPIGIDGSGNLVQLDIHEKFHGPHGLIAGSTGSGKSEFIITYILSLIINYHPDDVTLILVDYKGGGLANAFERENIKIPHLVGTITNIDKSGLQRSVESIESELKRRQIEFNKAKNITGESTIDIYKYQRYFHEGVLKKPISHLLIICDEFAELKQQEPDFMDKIVSIARIGRSLGVHLILATQKPSGVVNDQIRSNTKFGICLKVQSKGDSSDVIGCGDAAMLKRAGQFYFKVGNDDFMALGQSGWAGAEYTPGVSSNNDQSDFVEFISNTGEIVKRVENIVKAEEVNLGDQNTNIVKYICELGEKYNIKEDPLWLPNIPENIYLEDLRKKYDIKDTENVINPIIGEYDDPSRQIQDIVRLNLSESGNTLIYGNAESGKEYLIRTIIYDIMTTHSPNEVNMYIIDLGSEATKVFNNIPQVGDIILANDKEKIYRFFMMFSKIITERKKKLSKYGGDYKYYLEKKVGKMPLILTFINNYDSFVENFGYNYEDTLQTIIRDGMSMGIIFVITAGSSNAIRYRMQQNFKNKVVLRMTKDDEYSSFFDHLGSKRPSNLFGRGLIEIEPKKICEYQMAKICDNEDWNDRILNVADNLNKKYKEKANKVAVVPEILTLNIVKPQIKGIESLPIGISYNTLDIIKYNFKKDLLNIITTKSLDEIYDFGITFIEELALLKDIEYYVIDAENKITPNKQDTTKQYIKIFQDFRNKKQPKTQIIVIIGVDKFVKDLGGDDMFKGSLDEAAKTQNIHLILIEQYKSLDQYRSSGWLSSYSNKENGVWIGPGVDRQYLFSIEEGNPRGNCTKSFGYYINKGEATFMKLLGMQEKKEDDDNE